MTYRGPSSWRGLGAVYAAGTRVAGSDQTEEQLTWSNGILSHGYGGYPAPECRNRAILPDGSWQDAAHAMSDVARVAHAGELAAGAVPPVGAFVGGYCFYLDADGGVVGVRLVYPSREQLTWAVQHASDAGGAAVLDPYLAVNPYGLPQSVAQLTAQLTTPQAQNVVGDPAAAISMPPVRAFGLPDDSQVAANLPTNIATATTDPMPPDIILPGAVSVDAQGATSGGGSWLPWVLAVGAVVLMTRGRRS